MSLESESQFERNTVRSTGDVAVRCFSQDPSGDVHRFVYVTQGAYLG